MTQHWTESQVRLLHTLESLESAGALGISREKLKIHFGSPARPNIYIQTRDIKLSYKDDPDEALSFVVPFLTNEKNPKIQIFVKDKGFLLNMICRFLEIFLLRLI